MCHDAGITHGHATTMMLRPPAVTTRVKSTSPTCTVREALYSSTWNRRPVRMSLMSSARPAKRASTTEKLAGLLQSLLDEFAVQLGSKFDLVMEEVQRERFGWPAVRQRLHRGIRARTLEQRRRTDLVQGHPPRNAGEPAGCLRHPGHEGMNLRSLPQRQGSLRPTVAIVVDYRVLSSCMSWCTR